MSQQHAYFSALRGFADLAPILQQDLTGAARLEHLKKEKWLVGEGSRSGDPAVVVSGTLGIYRSMTSRSALIGIVGSGVSIGHMPSFNKEVPYSAVCRTNAVVARFPGLPSSSDRDRSGRISGWLLQLQGRQLATSLQRTADRVSLRPLARVASELLYLQDQFENGCIDVTQDEMAEMVGLSRKTVNRCLAMLSREKVVSTGYASLRIVDRGRLGSIAVDD